MTPLLPAETINGTYVWWTAGAKYDTVNLAGLDLGDWGHRTLVLPTTAATPASPSTCYDNNGAGGN